MLEASVRTGGLMTALGVIAAALAAFPARADDTMTLPCAMPAAVALGDRPGTGRSVSAGGSPCVAPLGEVVMESGVRTQQTTAAHGTDTLTSWPLTFLRTGIARRWELGIATPLREVRAITGAPNFDNAAGWTDMAVVAKYQVLDTASTQISVAAGLTAPTGTGEFTNGLPTYGAGVNAGIAITPRLSFATSLNAGTAIGPDARGANHPYFVFAPSFTLAYAVDSVDTLLLQSAITSRQAPIAPAGNRALIGVLRALGERLSIDAEYEHNVAPLPGLRQNALGFGFVWILAPPRR